MVAALIVGLVAGYLARLFMPGRTPRGILVTLFLGLAGALVGWLIFTKLLGIGAAHPFNLGGLPGAIIGTMILLYLHRRLVVEPRRGYGRR